MPWQIWLSRDRRILRYAFPEDKREWPKPNSRLIRGRHRRLPRTGLDAGCGVLSLRPPWYAAVRFSPCPSDLLGSLAGYRPEEIALNRNADEIVVFTGGASRTADALGLLAAGRGQRLLISGAHRVTNSNEIARLNPAFAYYAHCCVDFDHSLNTFGNAVETRKWAERRALRSLIVVTSNYHMPRRFGRTRPPTSRSDADCIPCYFRAAAFAAMVVELGNHKAADVGISEIYLRPHPHRGEFRGHRLMERQSAPEQAHAGLGRRYGVLLRSMIFNVLFYLNLALQLIAALPTLIMPRIAIVKVATFWGITQSLAASHRLRHSG